MNKGYPLCQGLGISCDIPQLLLGLSFDSMKVELRLCCPDESDVLLHPAPVHRRPPHRILHRHPGNRLDRHVRVLRRERRLQDRQVRTGKSNADAQFKFIHLLAF